jgi:glutathione S-transferase
MIVFLFLCSCPLLVSTLVLADRAPSWAHLAERVVQSTNTGRTLYEEAQQRLLGLGSPHIDAALRLFDAADENSVRVTFYRDHAGWCPYCQKVWIMLEEKRIPYRVQTVPLNAYGDKPSWFTRKVDGGKLPGLELDGQWYQESLTILNLLDQAFPHHGRRMTPCEDDASLAEQLQAMEQKLQRAWFSLTFYPVAGEALAIARSNLMEVMQQINKMLGINSGPWFLGGNAPSIVDINYITTLERIIPSVLYWKGITIRGRFDNIDRWLAAMETRSQYLATKSDFYNTVRILPSQNGPGYSIPEARRIADQIYGLDGAWELPLTDIVEPLAPMHTIGGEEAARHEAAFALTSNHERVVTFACRGAGMQGNPTFHAELADPYAEPDEAFRQPVDVCLRHVTAALLDGTDAEFSNARQSLAGNAGNGELRPGWGAYKDDAGKVYYWNEVSGDVTWTPPTMQLDTCLAYLRDRIGVPRDMGPAAAMQLRSHLNWVIAIMQ